MFVFAEFLKTSKQRLNINFVVVNYDIQSSVDMGNVFWALVGMFSFSLLVGLRSSLICHTLRSGTMVLSNNFETSSL